eukprot:3150678-Pleurochrysis_carterae.AAC.1
MPKRTGAFMCVCFSLCDTIPTADSKMAKSAIQENLSYNVSGTHHQPSKTKTPRGRAASQELLSYS